MVDLLSMIGTGLQRRTQERPENGQIPDDSRKAAAMVDRLWESGMRKMQPYHRQWYINMAYLLGFQHLVWHPTKNTLWLPPSRRRRVRMTSNKIMPAYRINLSKLASLETLISILPNSNEQEDIDASRMGKQLWEHLKIETGWRERRRKISSWALSTGNGFAEITWNPHAGERLMNFVQQPMTVERDGAPFETSTIAGVEEFRAGVLSIQSRSPFTFVPVGGGTDMDFLKAGIAADWMSKSEMERKFPGQTEGIATESRRKGSTFEFQLESLVSPTTGQTSGAWAEDEEEGALVKRYYQTNDHQHPQGRLIIVAGGKAIHNDVNPNPEETNGRVPLPWRHYKEIDVPFRFWGRSSIEDQIPDQKGLNKAMSIAIEHHSLFKGKWTVPKGAGLKEGTLTNSADEVVEYTPIAGQKPDQMSLEPPQQTLFTMVGLHIRNMEDSSGVREVSKGINPAGTRSAMAIQELQEADNSQIAITSQSMSDEDAKTATLSLRLVEQYMKMPQKLRIIGKNSSVVVLEGFTGDMLKGNTQVVAAGPTIPFSLTAKRAEILELASQGYFIDPDTGQINRKLVLEMLEFGKVEDVFSEEAMEETQATEENRMMERGQLTQPKGYQDHILHTRLHDRRRKSPEYQRLIQQTPQIEQIYDIHQFMHAQFLQQEALGEMQRMGQLPEADERQAGAEG